MDFNKITDVQIEGIDMTDYPDFCDAYIERCAVDGIEATEEQLDAINADSRFVHEQVYKELW